MCLTLAFLIDRFAFGKREDANPDLKYFSAEDFNLSAESISLLRNIRGFIYKKGVPDKDKLIIFCHGMGPGQMAYTTEIAYFCNLGYAVLAADSVGCGVSGGKKIKGMYSGAETVISAIDFARGSGYEKIWLVGHSWGGYSALCASAKRKVEGVVAISAPASPSKTIQDGAAPVISRPLAAFLRPYLWMVNLLKYGAKGNSDAAKCAEKNDAPTLLIHGDCDKTVSEKNAAYFKANGKNVKKLLAAGKGHNPYNTENAEKLLYGLTLSFKNRTYDKEKFDFAGATEEDPRVMKEIAGFIENN